MQKIFKASVLAVFVTLFGSVEAFAAGTGPTVSDAHEFIGELVKKGNIRNQHAIVEGVFIDYKGNDCITTINANSAFLDSIGWYTASYTFNWSDISSIDSSASSIKLFGSFKSTLTFTKDGSSDFYVVPSFDIYASDEVVCKKLIKAINLLVNSCHKSSKFD